MGFMRRRKTGIDSSDSSRKHILVIMLRMNIGGILGLRSNRPADSTIQVAAHEMCSTRFWCRPITAKVGMPKMTPNCMNATVDDSSLQIACVFLSAEP